MSHETRLLGMLIVVLASVPMPALAQYKWVDDTGQVVYSDQPPLKARAGVQVMRGSVAVPHSSAAPTPVPSSAAPSPAAPAGSGAAPSDSTPAIRPPGSGDAAVPAASDKSAAQTTADRELAFRRRQQEREDAERKQAEEAQKAARLTRVCADMRADLRALASGTRISRIDDGGERRYLGEDEIAQRVDSVRKSLTEQCSRG